MVEMQMGDGRPHFQLKIDPDCSLMDRETLQDFYVTDKYSERTLHPLELSGSPLQCHI